MLSTMWTIIHCILFKGNGNASNLNYLGLMFCFVFKHLCTFTEWNKTSMHVLLVLVFGFRAFLFSTTKSPAFFVRFMNVNDSSLYNQNRPLFFTYCRLPKVLFCFLKYLLMSVVMLCFCLFYTVHVPMGLFTNYFN